MEIYGLDSYLWWQELWWYFPGHGSWPCAEVLSHHRHWYSVDKQPLSGPTFSCLPTLITIVSFLVQKWCSERTIFCYFYNLLLLFCFEQFHALGAEGQFQCKVNLPSWLRSPWNHSSLSSLCHLFRCHVHAPNSPMFPQILPTFYSWFKYPTRGVLMPFCANVSHSCMFLAQ